MLHARRTLFSLPAVSYAKTGLPPAISPQAMDLHLNKHHQTYVNNANKLVTGTPHESATLEQVSGGNGVSVFFLPPLLAGHQGHA